MARWWGERTTFFLLLLVVSLSFITEYAKHLEGNGAFLSLPK